MKWERLLEEAPWSVRAMPRGGMMDGYFYLMSGRSGMFTIYSDVWRSPDGVNWERMTAKAEWGKRAYPEVDIIQGHLILTRTDVSVFLYLLTSLVFHFLHLGQTNVAVLSSVMITLSGMALLWNILKYHGLVSSYILNIILNLMRLSQNTFPRSLFQ